MKYQIHFRYFQDNNTVTIGPVFSSDIPEAILGQLRRDNRVPVRIDIETYK